MLVSDSLQRRWVWLVGVYLILLLASFVVRFARAEKPVSADKKSIVVAAVKNDRLLENTRVRFAYKEFAPAEPTAALPIILIHGSPGESSVLADLAEELSRTRRVIVPDLPGFGDSTRSIPDYSFRAVAFYLQQLADELGIQRFHALGFSMGGGVALNFYDIVPERVASIEFVSAIGVQEYELLGDYYFNRVLHGAQFLALLALRELTPHFGYLDRTTFGVSYARNFFDSDQRPLRRILERIEPPFLIVHGERDSLVPVEAAREHARLVPQSEYQELSDNHFMIFMRPEKIAPTVADFLFRVENGTARNRGNADPVRVEAANQSFHLEMIMADGSTAFVFFLALVLATFVSDDLTALAAGALAGSGQISLTLAIVACLVGVYTGDLLLYFAGRFFGRAALSRAPLRWFVGASAVERSTAWLEKNSVNAVFIARFVPAFRLPLYVAAGMLGRNFGKYAVLFLVTDLLYVPLLVGAAWWFSQGMMGMMPMFSGNFWLGTALFVGAAFVALNLMMRMATWRGRRMLVGSFKRWTEWEFWGLRTFYFPVVVYIVRLAVKFRSLSVFADANPIMEASGFVGESKREIYTGLRGSKPAEDHLLQFVFVPRELESNDKLRLAADFLRDNHLKFPVAFKPNAGERGAGVFLVKTREELQNRLERAETDLILQEFAAGAEFSVFYCRRPNEERGQIFSITEKRFPVVTGDGRATIETLILRDRRAVALAGNYFERNAWRLDYVPKMNEQIELVDIGTHSKGAIFLDGERVKTVELENKIDEICRGYAGFYFGRFDLRTASVEDFERGDFKIIELNGVTSEATNIYDPKNSLVDAYRILFRQWRIAFEIGAANRKLGARPTTVWVLLKLLRENWFGKTTKKSATRNSQAAIEKCV